MLMLSMEISGVALSQAISANARHGPKEDASTGRPRQVHRERREIFSGFLSKELGEETLDPITGCGCDRNRRSGRRQNPLDSAGSFRFPTADNVVCPRNNQLNLP